MMISLSKHILFYEIDDVMHIMNYFQGNHIFSVYVEIIVCVSLTGQFHSINSM